MRAGEETAVLSSTFYSASEGQAGPWVWGIYPHSLPAQCLHHLLHTCTQPHSSSRAS